MSGDLEALGEQIAELAAHLDAATHRLLAHLREFDARGGWYAQGAKSCAHWLAWRVGWDLVTARERVRVANKLGEFPAIDDALRRGELSYSKVRALLRVATPANEATILEQARLTTAAQLEKLSRKYALVQRHGQERRPEDDVLRRYVRRRDTDDGMVKIEAVLHPEEAELVWTMLDHAAKHLAREHLPAPGCRGDSAESCADSQLSQSSSEKSATPGRAPDHIAAGTEVAADSGSVTVAGALGVSASSFDDSAESRAEIHRSQSAAVSAATFEPSSRWSHVVAERSVAAGCIPDARPTGASATSSGDSAESWVMLHESASGAALTASCAVEKVAESAAAMDLRGGTDAIGVAEGRLPAASRDSSCDAAESCASQVRSSAVSANPDSINDAAPPSSGAGMGTERSLLDRLLDEADALREAAEAVAPDRGVTDPLAGTAHVTPSSYNPVPQPSILRQRVDAARRAFDRADALVSISQAYLRGDRPERAPIDVMVTIPATSLREDATDTVDVGCMGVACISAETARRLSCDAGVIEVLEDDEGVPLSVGRKRRTIAGSIKRALLKRDGACCYPGCTNRTFLEGHHIEHWADGGATSLDNAALLCSHHHRFVHEYGYAIELGDDHRPRFRDPRGRLVTAVPVRHAGADLGWSHILAANAPLAIDARTIACEWDGHPADYGRMVGELVVVDELV